jgi:hypothetical protein
VSEEVKRLDYMYLMRGKRGYIARFEDPRAIGLEDTFMAFSTLGELIEYIGKALAPEPEKRP